MPRHDPQDDLDPDSVPTLRVAAIVHSDRGSADVLLAQLAASLRERGRKVSGLLQEKTGNGKTGTVLVDLEEGTRYPLFQDLGPGSTSCSVDASALSAASAVLRRALGTKPDLVFVNRFGELETKGGGLAAEMLALMAEGVPLIMVVADDNLPAWRRFTEGAGTELPPSLDALEGWLAAAAGTSSETPPQPATLLAELHATIVDGLGPDVRNLVIERVVLGLFFTGVKLSNGVGGLCATPIKGMPEAVCCPSSAATMAAPGRMAGTPVLKVLDGLVGPKELTRAVSIATLNALAETLWRRDGPPAGSEVRDGDAFDALPLLPGKRVALVGAFPPYLRKLRGRGEPFSILELDPATLRQDEMPFYVPAERAPEIIPQVDVLIVTGTTLVNGSLDGLLGLLRPGAEAAVIGPTTTLVADPYRRRAVTVVGGTRVLAPDEVLETLAQGGSGYHLFGKGAERVTLRLRPM